LTSPRYAAGQIRLRRSASVPTTKASPSANTDDGQDTTPLAGSRTASTWPSMTSAAEA
jgi:hypothetical protein